MKVILSTFGPLHLIKSAEFLSKYVDMHVVQGWIPNNRNRWLIYFASKIIGRDLYKSFKKRTPDCLAGKNHSVGLPEFYLWLLLKFNIGNILLAPLKAANLYGRMSRKHITGGNIFHVRSGSGFNGAIEKAHSLGMKVLVDHSIAHPHFMTLSLKEEYIKNGEIFSMGDDTPFWKEVINDCKKGDRILVNSEFVKRTFVDEGFDASKIDVVLLGVRNDFFSLKKSYEVRDKIRLLFTGSFGFRKGAEYLLKALSELDNIGFDYELYVVGDCSGSEKLVQKYNPKGLKMIGFVPQDDLKLYLSSSDIYVFPSLCEGCASSGMEAMAAGLPVIATEESGLPIVSGQNGIIVESKSVEQIKNAILQLSSSMALREQIGKAAATTISENYTWEKYAEKVYSIYESMNSCV